MKPRRRAHTWALRMLAPAVGAAVLLVAAPIGNAQSSDESPADWVARNAVPLRSLDPEAPLDDLAHLRRSIGDATIVALGESTHGTLEQTVLKHRTVRYLVEELGYRSIAWEDDWTLGVQIDNYIRTGKGDLDALVRQMSTAWHTEEVTDVLRWLRRHNANHRDQVRFVGVEYFTTRAWAYDAVKRYVARHAPERLGEIRGHLEPIRPNTDDMGAYLNWYLNDVDDKAPYVRHAKAAYRLVKGLPHRPGDRRHAVTLHHARQILSWYEGFSLPFLETLTYRDARAAENLRWWERFHSPKREGVPRSAADVDKIIYWAASPHTSNNPNQRITVPSSPDWTFPSAGSYLRRWYGEQYLSIGHTFDHGTIHADSGETITMPPPARDWFEGQFGKVPADHFTLDLRSPAPPSAQEWLHAPATTRGLPDMGSESQISGGSLSQWFDMIIHWDVVTPAHPA